MGRKPKTKDVAIPQYAKNDRREFFGQTPRFARLHIGDWGEHRIGPVYSTEAAAISCESTDTRQINRRGVRHMGGHQYIDLPVGIVALVKVSRTK